jgi:ubiquinone/menaquinone biosynthesis C-methylase UbiE
MINNNDFKKHFNRAVVERFADNYEFNRWFMSRRLRLDYFMSYYSIQFFANRVKFSDFLEVGPGPGTWTRIFFRRCSDAKFDLVDISQEMKRQFFLEMRNQENINYIVADIAKYDFNKKYDFFFSSRAIEYFNDKDHFLEKIYNVLVSGAKGIIITKNPDIGFWGKSREGRKWQHTAQIKPKDLIIKLSKAGFKKIEAYPVIIRVPLFDRFTDFFANKIYMRWFNKPLKNTMINLCESYLIVFEK